MLSALVFVGLALAAAFGGYAIGRTTSSSPPAPPRPIESPSAVRVLERGPRLFDWEVDA